MSNKEINWNKWKGWLLLLRHTSLPVDRIQCSKKPCLCWDGSFGDVGLSSPAWYGCLTLVLLSVPTLFRNKSLHIIWLSNHITGNDGCKIETTHIQSQRARLRITLEQVIKNNTAPLETIRASCHSGLFILALSACWFFFLPAHFGWHWHTVHLAVSVPITELLFRAARLWSKAAGGTLKPFQTFGFSVGKLACYDVHLIYFFRLHLKK